MALQAPFCDGTLDLTGPSPTCTGTWIAVDDPQAVSTAISNLIAVLQELFTFDEAFFSIVFTALIVSWITGHYVGRMMQAWRKGM